MSNNKKSIKTEFETPSIEVVMFSSKDVIATSDTTTIDIDPNKGEWDFKQ